jgi:hypothetical protein
MATSALGVKGRTVAERKVQEIVEKTGFTPDEVVSKIMRGELLAEDQSMNAIMKVLKQESGEANRRMQAILDYEKGAASSRVRDVEAVAQESLQSALAPASRMDDNLVDYLNASKADQAKVVRDAYGDVFNNPVQLSDELWSDATELMKGNRTVQKKLEDIYSTDPRASKFFKVDKNGRIQTDSRGRIILTRRPTIEDAELIKRGLDDAITEFYKGNTTAANNLADRRDAFVTKLNKFAPELEQARARASVFIDSGKAYKRGLTDLGRENQEEVMSFVNKLVDLAESGSPEQLDAYRLAILTSLKNKFGGKQDIATALSSPGSNQYTLLSKIVPEGQLDKVLEDLGVASKSRKSISKMSVGSDTQDKLLAQSLVRAPIPTQAIADALRGNFTTVLPAIIGMFNKGLSDRQLGEVTRIILADKNNVDLMKRALYDDGAFGQLQNLVNATVRTAFGGVRRQASANPRDTAVGLFGLMQ